VVGVCVVCCVCYLKPLVANSLQLDIFYLTLHSQFVPGLDGLSAGKDLEVKVTCIDRLGMDLRIATQEVSW
jgi:hypothetical protein